MDLVGLVSLLEPLRPEGRFGTIASDLGVLLFQLGVFDRPRPLAPHSVALDRLRRKSEILGFHLLPERKLIPLFLGPVIQPLADRELLGVLGPLVHVVRVVALGGHQRLERLRTEHRFERVRHVVAERVVDVSCALDR
eukprot:978385-Pyramimonas_sp.AAC.1